MFAVANTTRTRFNCLLKDIDTGLESDDKGTM